MRSRLLIDMPPCVHSSLCVLHTQGRALVSEFDLFESCVAIAYADLHSLKGMAVI